MAQVNAVLLSAVVSTRVLRLPMVTEQKLRADESTVQFCFPARRVT